MFLLHTFLSIPFGELFGVYLCEALWHLPDLYKNSLLKQWGDTGRC